MTYSHARRCELLRRTAMLIAEQRRMARYRAISAADATLLVNELSGAMQGRNVRHVMTDDRFTVYAFDVDVEYALPSLSDSTAMILQDHIVRETDLDCYLRDSGGCCCCDLDDIVLEPLDE